MAEQTGIPRLAIWLVFLITTRAMDAATLIFLVGAPVILLGMFVEPVFGGFLILALAGWAIETGSGIARSMYDRNGSTDRDADPWQGISGGEWLVLISLTNVRLLIAGAVGLALFPVSSFLALAAAFVIPVVDEQLATVRWWASPTMLLIGIVEYIFTRNIPRPTSLTETIERAGRTDKIFAPSNA